VRATVGGPPLFVRVLLLPLYRSSNSGRWVSFPFFLAPDSFFPFWGHRAPTLLFSPSLGFVVRAVKTVSAKRGGQFSDPDSHGGGHCGNYGFSHGVKVGRTRNQCFSLLFGANPVPDCPRTSFRIERRRPHLRRLGSISLVHADIVLLALSDVSTLSFYFWFWFFFFFFFFVFCFFCGCVLGRSI